MALVHIFGARNIERVCCRLLTSRNISCSIGYSSNGSTGDDSKINSNHQDSGHTQSQRDNKMTAKQFNHPAIQEILCRITGLDLAKIYRSRPQEENKMPTYKLLTDSEFKAAEAKAIQEAKRLLTMPPQLPERERKINDIIKVDKEFVGYDEDNVNYVFTDISLSAADQGRRIVVRQPNGALRYATWSERDRMNQIYYPKPGRKLNVPAMFHPNHLQNTFSQLRHADLLDLTVLQFEPDSFNYIQVHHATYEDIVLQKNYDLLRSTRHFGGLAYYLVKNNRFHGLLNDMLERKLISDAGDLVSLFCLMHPQNSFARKMKEINISKLEMLKDYMKSHESLSSNYDIDQLVKEDDNLTGEEASIKYTTDVRN